MSKKIGKLAVRVAELSGKPDCITISATNERKGDKLTELFTVQGDRVTLRISKETAAKLAQFIDEILDEDMPNAGLNPS